MSVFQFVPLVLYKPDFTWDNYVRVLTRPVYIRSLLLSVVIALVAMVICTVVGYAAAYHIVFRSGRFKGLLIGFIVTVFLTSFVIKIYAWMILLAPKGSVWMVLNAVGLAPDRLRLIGTPGAVLIGLVYAALPYMILSLMSSLEQISQDTRYAAATLGAPGWKRFFYVELPMTTPGLVTGTLFVFALSMGAFVAPALLGEGRVQMTALFIYQQSTGSAANWPLSAALAIVLTLATLMATVLVLELTRRLSNLSRRSQ